MLAGTVLGEFADLYHAGATLHLSRQEVDDMEPWELASMLGMHRPGEPGKAGEQPKRDLVAERIAHARGQGPKPQPDRRSAPIDPNLAKLIPMHRSKAG